MTERNSLAGSNVPQPEGGSPERGWFHPAPPQDRPVEPPEEPEQSAPLASAPTEPARSRSRAFAAVVPVMVRNWPILLILAAFAVAAVVVPTMTNVATTDDWGYTRSVEILLDEGTLKVFPVVAATAVGQVLWGAIFGLVFGMSLGVMRLSTVVMTALGGIALYAILRQLGVSRSRSALGMGVWLFNPLTFALSFTFMTDPHFSAVMLISLAFYVRGLRPGREHVIAIVTGSIMAGFAFWIRQQGALIPLGVGMYLLLTGHLRPNRESVRRIVAVALLPALMLVTYYAWLRWFNDVPDVQQEFFDEVRDAGWSGTWLLVRRIPVYVLFYAGLLLLPIVVSIFPRRQSGGTPSLASSPLGFYAFGAWAAVVTGGLFYAARRGQEMPFAAQFVGPSGFLPPDVLGSRQRLYERGTEIPALLTVAAATGAIVIGLVICRRIVSERSPERAGFWLVVMVGFWQLAGILPPSFHYLRRGVTLDRYLLPMVAIFIIVALWSLRDVQLLQPVGWLALAAVAVFSTAAARDSLVYMDAVWGMARYANDHGVENDRLDAGSGWDGYHLYTTMLDDDVTKARSPSGSPWWVYFYAKPTDSSYIVSTDPSVRFGYVVEERREYDQWLEDDPVYVYLLRRWYLPFPVEAESGNGLREIVPGAPGPTAGGRQEATPAATPAASPVATPAATPSTDLPSP